MCHTAVSTPLYGVQKPLRIMPVLLRTLLAYSTQFIYGARASSSRLWGQASSQERPPFLHRFGLAATVYPTTPSAYLAFSRRERPGYSIVRWSRRAFALCGSSTLPSIALRPVGFTVLPASSAAQSSPSCPLYRLPRLSATATVYPFSFASLSLAVVRTSLHFFHSFGTPRIRYQVIL